MQGTGEHSFCWLRASSDALVVATEAVSTQPKSSRCTQTATLSRFHKAGVSRKVFQPQGDELGDESTPAGFIETNVFQIAMNAQQSDGYRLLFADRSAAGSEYIQAGKRRTPPESETRELVSCQGTRQC